MHSSISNVLIRYRVLCALKVKSLYSLKNLEIRDRTRITGSLLAEIVNPFGLVLNSTMTLYK